ncbi:hypothetical protein [Streptomyces afghaniensis]|uniref:hypothetical protein n=1 Tax=Streptomyces afghaniensis TaxID=66865 RepID=UPI0037A0930F
MDEVHHWIGTNWRSSFGVTENRDTSSVTRTAMRPFGWRSPSGATEDCNGTLEYINRTGELLAVALRSD